MTGLTANLPICLIDFETRSYWSVTDIGAWRYAQDPTTEVLCMGWKLGDKIGLWVPDLHKEFPPEVLAHVEAGGTFEAHNVQFERAIWMLILRPRYGIQMPLHWKDTMAVCAYRGIPLGLDKAGKALDLPIQKDEHGKHLLNTLCRPKWGTKKEPDRIYREDWDLMQDLYQYCEQDVIAEECLGDTLGDLPPAEQFLWLLDQRINQRGVLIDMEAIDSALRLIKTITTDLNGQLFKLTDEEVKAATQRDKLLGWLNRNGLPYLANLRKETLEDLTRRDRDDKFIIPDMIKAPEKTQQVLHIRMELAKASTKKFQKMQDTVSSDRRIRGMLQYHGANTGRWAGRLAQPHNFPRPNKDWNMDELVADLRLEDADFLKEKYKSPMSAISSALRGMFIAAPDHVLRVCDFSAIEARVTFWVAGCETGLEVFATSDRGDSEDIYCVTASDLVGFEVKKKEHGHERQLGKITVLGCGYQMGWKRLQIQAADDYNVILDGPQAKGMVDLYRSKYKEVPWLWYGLQDAAIATVKTGHPHTYRSVMYDLVEDAAGRWLACQLPNGRRIWYYEPHVADKQTPWGATQDGLRYYGRDNKKGGSWGLVDTYGGMLTENVVQAISRDLMAEAMIRVEDAGYPIILTVHDEIISEVETTYGSQEEFERIMAMPVNWAPGCPIAVEGGAVQRYRKI